MDREIARKRIFYFCDKKNVSFCVLLFHSFHTQFKANSEREKKKLLFTALPMLKRTLASHPDQPPELMERKKKICCTQNERESASVKLQSSMENFLSYKS
jgi:hypothetical protein